MEQLPDVSRSAIAVWVAFAVMIALAAGTITSRGLGPISKAYFEFAKRRREAIAAREAGDLAGLRRSITNLLAMREADVERIAHMETYMNAYAEWGFAVQQIAAAAGLKLPPAPKLVMEDL
jgi:hypothetical protein